MSDNNNIPDISLLNKKALGDKFYEIFDTFSHTAEGQYVYITYIPEDISLWSKEAVEYFGLPGELMKGAGPIWTEHVEESSLPEYMQNLQDLFEGKIKMHDIVYRARNKDGQYVTCSCKGEIIRDDEGNPIYFAGTIINYESAETVDPVTGLYSRNNLLFGMQAMMKESRPYYLMVMGIINFYEINSMYGYRFGNLLLKKAAEYLMHIQKNGVHAFRCEGVKSALLFDASKYSMDDIREIYNDYRNYLLTGLYVQDIHVAVEICGSAILANEFSMDYNTVYNSALYSLSTAKEENMTELHIFENSAFSENSRRLEILNKIRSCITGDCEGFYLTYQPIVDANTDKIAGAEALIRWRDKKYGIVPPNNFIPWLEKDPIFFELGNWILRQAMQDTRDIIKKYPDFIVNVNLAYPQLQRPDFKTSLNDILKEENYPAENLKLELTERCKMRDTNMLRNDMVFFKSAGIQTALDDFGTGYSALNLLVELPIDQVKIDRSFIIDIENDISKQSLLRAITNCASELNKNVCVEGVESAEMRDYLRDNFTVTNFQGYFYSKPLPIDEFLDWLTEYEK